MGPSWLAYFQEMAVLVASKSKDPSTKVGCVVVGPDMEVRATGYNGFPRGVADSVERLADRDGKLHFMVHAEANAVAAAARVGTSLKGCTVVVTKFPCPQCTALLIQSGVSSVIAPPANDGSRWSEQNQTSVVMLREAGVPVQEAA
jgi:dCMP deaminase